MSADDSVCVDECVLFSNKSKHSRLSNAPVVGWTVEGQAPESSLYIEAALILRARVRSRHTFVNI